MISYKYGTYSDSQLSSTKQYIRKQIFYLLLYVDLKTKAEYPNVNVEKAFIGLQYKLSGLNSLLFEPPSLVNVMSMLEAAFTEYQSKDTFNFNKYRKLILDAGNEILKIDDSKVDAEKVSAFCDEIDKKFGLIVDKEV